MLLLDVVVLETGIPHHIIVTGRLGVVDTPVANRVAGTAKTTTAASRVLLSNTGGLPPLLFFD